jgi:GxxExxY protein
MLKYVDVTERIIKAFYRVYNTLGHGFLEKVYENALAIELARQGLRVQRQAPIKVYYEEHEIGEYFADLLVENCVIVELKAAEALCQEHHAQVINYLKATGFEVGLLFTFGPKPEMKRKVFQTARPKPTPLTDPSV